MLGFVIFGWGKREKTIGAASAGYCDNCHNDIFWYLVKRRRWFSLFWIPVLPLHRANYYLACEICGAAGQLEKHEAREAKEMTKVTAEFDAGEVTEDEYSEAVAEFRELVGTDESGGQNTAGSDVDEIEATG